MGAKVRQVRDTGICRAACIQRVAKSVILPVFYAIPVQFLHASRVCSGPGRRSLPARSPSGVPGGKYRAINPAYLGLLFARCQPNASPVPAFVSFLFARGSPREGFRDHGKIGRRCPGLSAKKSEAAFGDRRSEGATVGVFKSARWHRYAVTSARVASRQSPPQIGKWAHQDLNLEPTNYEFAALTN